MGRYDKQIKAQKALEPADREMLLEGYQLLNRGAYSEAAATARERLAGLLPETRPARALLIGALAGLLVDIGGEASREGELKEGLQVLQQHRELLVGELGEEVHEYNLGNAKESLYKIEYLRTREYRLESIALLTEAKNHYWSAYRAAVANGRMWPALLVNLGNSLSTAGRVAEALVWYAKALRLEPTHPMALGNRSDCLGWLSRLSDTWSLSLAGRIREGYKQALQSDDLPAPVRAGWEPALARVTEVLKREGYDTPERLHEEMKTAEEAAVHTAYRDFCLKEGLILSEHALYCPCVGARRDDLSIPKGGTGITGDFVPRMELLLNRLKGEFSLARVLFYQATQGLDEAWSVEAFEGTYTELFDDEAVGLPTEMLRTSFRLCFGILDRIAYGISDLLDLAEPSEDLYFHSFWKKPKPASEKQRTRWQKLNDSSTPSLLALYSQATDLNAQSGEWKHFKEWRNATEHELLVIITDEEGDLGPFVEAAGFEKVVVVPVEEFQRETLHLLRFTASAIFNFALFVRQHALRMDAEGGLRVTLDKKPVGPE